MFQIVVALLIEVCQGAEQLLARYSVNNTNEQSERSPLSHLVSCGPKHLDLKYRAVELSNDGATCNLLEHSLLEQPRFVEGSVYLTKTMGQVELKPPVLLDSRTRKRSFRSFVPFVFDNGSFVELHFNLASPFPILSINFWQKRKLNQFHETMVARRLQKENG